jgi:predicted transcriptional regulator of viral defense system
MGGTPQACGGAGTIAKALYGRGDFPDSQLNG